jgi:hypothetical protein
MTTKVNGILWTLRTGAPGATCPSARSLAEAGEPFLPLVPDGGRVRAHSHAAGTQGLERQALGRSQGGLQPQGVAVHKAQAWL